MNITLEQLKNFQKLNPESSINDFINSINAKEDLTKKAEDSVLSEINSHIGSYLMYKDGLETRIVNFNKPFTDCGGCEGLPGIAITDECIWDAHDIPVWCDDLIGYRIVGDVIEIDSYFKIVPKSVFDAGSIVAKNICSIVEKFKKDFQIE